MSSSAAKSEQGQALRCPDGVRREFKEMPPLPEITEEARNAKKVEA